MAVPRSSATPRTEHQHAAGTVSFGHEGNALAAGRRAWGLVQSQVVGHFRQEDPYQAQHLRPTVQERPQRHPPARLALMRSDLDWTGPRLAEAAWRGVLLLQPNPLTSQTREQPPAGWRRLARAGLVRIQPGSAAVQAPTAATAAAAPPSETRHGSAALPRQANNAISPSITDVTILPVVQTKANEPRVSALSGARKSVASMHEQVPVTV